MLTGISYNIKFKLLLGFAALFAFFIYQSALSKTIELYKRNKELDRQLELAKAAPGQLEALHRKLAYMDRILQSQETDSLGDNHDALLGIVSGYCKEHNIVLKNFPAQVLTDREGFYIQTNTFTIQSSFLNALQLIYQLEQKERTGKISSVSFSVTKEVESRKQILLTTIYQQNIKKGK